jgi:AcrR family transcriptional regulator
MGQTSEAQPDAARERILATAYDLFSHRGIRDVGIGEVIENASIAKATLYRHFPSKDDLVIAFLDLRGHRWTEETLEAEARRRASSAEGRLLAIFDVLDEWFRGDDYECCSFVNVLLEMRPDHPAGREAKHQLERVRDVIRTFAEEAGLRDTERFAVACQLLVNGSIVCAAAGNSDAARPAQELARGLIELHR